MGVFIGLSFKLLVDVFTSFQVRVLYLQAGSHLVDCLDVEDTTIAQSDLVTDYKKMNKHKWVNYHTSLPVKL